MKGDRVFLDTNVIVYAYDASAGVKHEVAAGVVEGLWRRGCGVVSTQVLQEFYVTVTRKIPKPLALAAAREVVADFLKWEVVVNDGQSILDAIDIQARHGFSFWDSMIIASAAAGGAARLLSEDLSDGQVVAGVAIANPFSSEFSQ
jgi:predicted nucleic acid-binding protein